MSVIATAFEKCKGFPTADMKAIHETGPVVEAVKAHVERVYGAGAFPPAAAQWLAFLLKLGMSVPQILQYLAQLGFPGLPPSGGTAPVPTTQATAGAGAAGPASALDAASGATQEA